MNKLVSVYVKYIFGVSVNIGEANIIWHKILMVDNIDESGLGKF